MGPVSWCTGMNIRTKAGPWPRSFFNVHHYAISVRGMIMTHMYNNEARLSRKNMYSPDGSHTPSFTMLMGQVKCMFG